MLRQTYNAFRRQVKDILESTLGVRIYIGAHGHDECTDIKAAFGHTPIKCVFDVGANVGQSARKFMAAFPRADIYCFEPVIECFNRLTVAVAANKRVHCHQIALGNADAEGTLYLTSHTMRSSLIRPG
ncbi:MAG TPA: FkbM family methyltransferase, partial [Planctomycetaceae bacterium]